MGQVKAVAAGARFTVNDTKMTVSKACDQNRGTWFCVTHKEGFTNQLQKDGHIRRGYHRLVWMCFEHGPETP